jgi:hypothetical protein
MDATAKTSTSPAAADAASAVAGAAATGAAAATTTQQPPSTSASFGGQPAPNSTLYVGNIFFEVSEQSLEDYFTRYGAIKKTRIVYDARGLSKGLVRTQRSCALLL